jgi:two-component system, chemotaxis family, sensor kinase CheA
VTVELDDAAREFLIESNENLDRIEQEILTLEQEPGNNELLNSVFRAIHTLKGNSGFLGLKNLETLSHSAESLLDDLRDSKIQMNSGIATTLLKVNDILRRLLMTYEQTGDDGTEPHAELRAEIQSHRAI